MIDAHKKGNQTVLNFSLPHGSFDPILVDEGKDGEEGYALGYEFYRNPPFADPNDEGDDEPTVVVYKEYAAQAFLGGRPSKHYANWLPFDAAPPSKFPTENNIKNTRALQLFPMVLMSRLY